jgi:hypothetical protein
VNPVVAVRTEVDADDVYVCTSLWMWCPACDDVCRIYVAGGTNPWSWDGNDERPTIDPSILVTGVQWGPDYTFHKPNHPGILPGGTTRCHSYVRDGRWQFLSDCTHTLANQTVDMVPLPDWFALQP